MAVDKFCGCAKLETGGLVVGLFGVIINALFIYIYLPPVIQKIKWGVFHLNDGFSVLMLIFLIYYFANLIASILLIIGTEKEYPGWISFWLVTSCISIFFSVLSVFISFNFKILFGIVLQIYWWVQIYALYQERQKKIAMALDIQQQVSDEIENVPSIESSQNDLVA